jgi:hypothetical protein
MTPTALSLDRSPKTSVEVRRIISACQFFDCRGIVGLIEEMADIMIQARDADASLANLPADPIWLEFEGLSLVVSRKGTTQWASIRIIRDDGLSRNDIPDIILGDGACRNVILASVNEGTERDRRMFGLMALATFALINGPSFCEKRVNRHSRQVVRSTPGLRVNGSFPLRSWTELIIRVGPQINNEQSRRRGGRHGLTALHFVRGHLKRVCGERKWIDPYWRGDGRLGIKRNRYRVIP